MTVCNDCGNYWTRVLHAPMLHKIFFDRGRDPLFFKFARAMAVKEIRLFKSRWTNEDPASERIVICSILSNHLYSQRLCQKLKKKLENKYA